MRGGDYLSPQFTQLIVRCLARRCVASAGVGCRRWPIACDRSAAAVCRAGPTRRKARFVTNRRRQFHSADRCSDGDGQSGNHRDGGELAGTCRLGSRSAAWPRRRQNLPRVVRHGRSEGAKPLRASDKANLDRQIAAHATASDAESKLRAHIRSSLRETAEELLASMLTFDPALRPTAKDLAARWGALANRLGSGARVAVPTSDSPSETFADIERFLGMVERREASTTDKQLLRMLVDCEAALKIAPDF